VVINGGDDSDSWADFDQGLRGSDLSMLPCHALVITLPEPALIHIEDPLSTMELLNQELAKILPEDQALRAVTLRRNIFDSPKAQIQIIFESSSHKGCLDLELVVGE
jgi:hypothetical protein